MDYSDRTLVCVECQAEFVFSATDQQHHAERGYTAEPKRCPDCRKKRKAASGGGNPGGGGGGGGRGNWSGGGGGGGARTQRQLYPAVCSSCGKQTEVPFKPADGRPVYCRDCFQSRKGQP